MKVTQAQKKAAIQALLQRNDRAVCRAILVIYARQTAAEQNTLTTREDNGVGFSGNDAEILTSFAHQLLGEGRYAGRPRSLSPRQMEIARKRMRRYHRQLADAAAERGRLEMIAKLAGTA